jgi:hypothetical protein
MWTATRVWFAIICMVCFGLSTTCRAGTVFYSDVESFLSAAGELGMESFKGMPTTQQSSSSIKTPDFTVSPPGLSHERCGEYFFEMVK